jgi:hypothetical protein
MNNHLTQDQLARWIVGDSGPEERQHVLQCLHCSREVKTFREAVATFQVAMREWSDKEVVPSLHVPAVRMDWSGWVAAGLAVGAIGILPWCAPVEKQEPIVATTINEDAQLMEEVAMHLSRPMPVSMERVIALFPEPEVEENQ